MTSFADKMRARRGEPPAPFALNEAYLTVAHDALKRLRVGRVRRRDRKLVDPENGLGSITHYSWLMDALEAAQTRGLPAPRVVVEEEPKGPFVDFHITLLWEAWDPNTGTTVYTECKLCAGGLIQIPVLGKWMEVGRDTWMDGLAGRLQRKES